MPGSLDEVDDPTRTGPGGSGDRPGGALRRAGFPTVMATVALIGLICALAGTFWATRPVRTPTQDCGSAAALLLDGRVDVMANPDDPPAGATADDVASNNAEPCQERAANRVRTGAVAVVFGLGVVAVTALTESIIRGGWRIRRRRPGR